MAKDVLARERVYRTLREAIIRGVLRTGTRIVELDVARELGVSRSPVREALRLLEGAGLVQVDSRGVVVLGMGPEEFEQVCRVRAMLEKMAAEEAARRSGYCSDQLFALRRLLETMDGHQSRADYRRCHREFHKAIARMSGNSYLETVIDRVLDTVDVVWETINPDEPRYNMADKEHRRLLDAVASGDSREAGKAVLAHLDLSRRDYVARLREIMGTQHRLKAIMTEMTVGEGAAIRPAMGPRNKEDGA